VAGQEANVEKLRELYGEWGRGDYSRGGDLFHPEMTMKTIGMGDPISAESLEEFVSAMRDWLSAWERPMIIEAEEFIPAGDRVLVLIRWSGRGKGSGARIEGEGAHLWTFRDGLVVDYLVYRDRDAAREALERG
jgi:ketosteroid isomerase-like protein